MKVHTVKPSANRGCAVLQGPLGYGGCPAGCASVLQGGHEKDNVYFVLFFLLVLHMSVDFLNQKESQTCPDDAQKMSE